MAELSAEDIAQRAFGLELLDDRSFREVRGEISQKQLDGEAFRQLLLRRGLLTPYQMDRLVRGDRAGFFYGNYKVLYQVGAGTFARVYRAVHRETGKVFGVKVLRQRFTTEAKKCEQFRQEAEVGLTLRHQNIVAIFEVGAEKAAQYIVMEFVEGQNLREFIKIRKQIAPADAVRLMADIARGLDYAARRGISHRDLKASNVLVASNGQAKLVDFGLAGVDPDASQELVGGIENPRTIDYVALDRVTGIPNGDVRGDIFFAGCILYRMLSGVPPLDETRDRILRSNPSRFLDIVQIKKRCPDIPPHVIAVVEHAMELNPKHRYQTPAEMLAELTVLQRRMTATEGAESAVAAPGEMPSKNRTVMIVESNAKLQDALRDQLKRSGYRVLVTSDPQRPIAWFAGGKNPADCVLFSTGHLGEQALAAFNEFGVHGVTSKIPAVLLLGSKHQDWIPQAKLAPHRVHITSPIKVPELMQLLDKLTAEPSAAGKG